MTRIRKKRGLDRRDMFLLTIDEELAAGIDPTLYHSKLGHFFAKWAAVTTDDPERQRRDLEDARAAEARAEERGLI